MFSSTPASTDSMLVLSCQGKWVHHSAAGHHRRYQLRCNIDLPHHTSCALHAWCSCTAPAHFCTLEYSCVDDYVSALSGVKARAGT